MSDPTPTSSSKIDTVLSDDFCSVTSLPVIRTSDGNRISLTLQDDSYVLSAAQADALATGLYAAALSSGAGTVTPWAEHQVESVTPTPASKSKKFGVSEVSSASLTSVKFFAMGWLYEGEGVDPDYPNNVVFIKVNQQDEFELVLGKRLHRLSLTQVEMLYLGLARAAYALKHKTWEVNGTTIRWYSSAETVLSQNL